MQVSFSHALENNRAHNSIGRVTAATGWRAADEPVSQVYRDIAVRALVREAEEYGADALVDVKLSFEEIPGADIEGVALRRITATGTAVAYAIAA